MLTLVAMLAAQAAELERLGALEGAEQLYRRILEEQPADPETHLRLGLLLFRRGQPEPGLGHLREAALAPPASAQRLGIFATALARQGRHAQAAHLFRCCAALEPQDADPYLALGNALQDLQQPAAAAAAFQKVVRLAPLAGEGYFQWGNALTEVECFDRAAECYRRAAALDPGRASLYTNLGIALGELGHPLAGLAAHHRATALAPDHANARFSLAHALLQHGAIAEGFREYEWRWRLADFPSPNRNFPQPLWDGRPFPGKTLLVHAEQGLGDAVQFCRYLPAVAALGGRVVLECRHPSTPLLRTLPGIAEVVEYGDPLPPFDLHLPMMSLPLACGTTAAGIPAAVPYLAVDPERRAHWRAVIGAPNRFKIGLVWAGNPRPTPRRSMPLIHLRQTAWPRGVALFSLQYGAAEAQLDAWGAEPAVTRLGAAIGDFADLAAAIDALDLLITIDSAPAHVAGALGKTVWTLLHFAADWRWLLAREDSPWYPTMRLFRQPRPGDWDGAMRQLADALSRHPLQPVGPGTRQ